MNNVSMIGENQQLDLDEPVEFEEIMVEVQDCSQLLINAYEFFAYTHI
jgi:hypothetical protein